jgi:ComF family protein
MADRFNARIQVNEYEPYAYAAALYHYRTESDYRKISQALKYHRDFGAGRWAARLLGERLAASPLYADVDLVVPVPLHWTRRWQRGYNQAEVIAREVAAVLGAACRPRLLRRRRRTRSQAHLQGSAAKAANVADAFVLRAAAPAHHILLIDDVFTTGSTLAACHKALRRHYGPQVRISVATLAAVGD